MNITLDTFEERIIWLLKQRGMSQKELAAQLDVSVQFLNSLVTGRRRPNVKRNSIACPTTQAAVWGPIE